MTAKIFCFIIRNDSCLDDSGTIVPGPGGVTMLCDAAFVAQYKKGGHYGRKKQTDENSDKVLAHQSVRTMNYSTNYTKEGLP